MNQQGNYFALETTIYFRPLCSLEDQWLGNVGGGGGGITVLTAHQHQKGHTVPKQVIMIATSIQVATV